MTKNQKSGRAYTVLDNGRLRQEQRKIENEVRFKFIAGKQKLTNEPSREAKR